MPPNKSFERTTPAARSVLLLALSFECILLSEKYFGYHDPCWWKSSKQQAFTRLRLLPLNSSVRLRFLNMQYSPQLEKTLRYMFWAAVLIPLQWPFLFYSFVFRARFSLGRWPYPYHPDPKSMGFDLHMLFILLSSLLVLISPLVVLYLFLMTLKVIKINRLKYVFAGLSFTVLLISNFVLVKYDPGRFIEWFMD